MEESVKGTKLVWKAKESPESMLGYFQNDGFSNAYLKDGYVCIDAICVGDLREKGISIVGIDNGKELTCVKPTCCNEAWEAVKDMIRTGVYEAYVISKSMLNKEADENPQCMYK